MNLTEVIRRPLDTEKFDRARDAHNQYAFEVAKKATKLQIKQAVETLFKVSVTEVTTQVHRGKWRRSGNTIGQAAAWKRAIVTLKKGDAISLFEAK